MEILFWSFIILVLYIYIGYGILLYILVKFSRADKNKGNLNKTELPAITLVVAAWNEEEVIEAKIKNTFEIDYPASKVDFIIISDGSTDNTAQIVKEYPEIRLLHREERSGKTAALNRAIEYVKTPIVIFSDANALLNKQSFLEIVKHYQDPKVGCVAGEKRIQLSEINNVASFGEGVYWKYESFLKKLDSKLYSCVGAAGELFSIRTALYEKVPIDTILDDFYISLRVAMRGYKIAYEPNAFAREYGSLNVKEEIKRKIRISAGGIQSIIRLSELMNPFKYGILTFQYISHRVLRWTLGPVAIFLLLPVNLYLLVETDSIFYNWFFFFHIGFYVLAFIGYLLGKKDKKVKIFYVPFYFLMMNYCVIKGFFKLIKGKQSVKWEKAQRASI